MLKEIITNIPPTLWGFIGAFIIAMASYRGFHHFAKIRESHANFNAAAINFRNALDAAIYQIKKGVNDVAVIESNFVAHIEAIRKFSHYLRGRQLDRFNRISDEYEEWYDVRCNIGTTIKLFPEENKEYMALKDVPAKPIIDKLLKFAEGKKLYCIKKT